MYVGKATSQAAEATKASYVVILSNRGFAYNYPLLFHTLCDEQP